MGRPPRLPPLLCSASFYHWLWCRYIALSSVLPRPVVTYQLPPPDACRSVFPPVLLERSVAVSLFVDVSYQPRAPVINIMCVYHLYYQGSIARSRPSRVRPLRLRGLSTRSRPSFCRRGCGCLATCTGLRGLEATSCKVQFVTGCKGVHVTHPYRKASTSPSGSLDAADLPSGGHTVLACNA